MASRLTLFLCYEWADRRHSLRLSAADVRAERLFRRRSLRKWSVCCLDPGGAWLGVLTHANSRKSLVTLQLGHDCWIVYQPSPKRHVLICTGDSVKAICGLNPEWKLWFGAVFLGQYCKLG